jgi:LysM domain
MGCDAGEIEAKTATFHRSVTDGRGTGRNIHAIGWGCGGIRRRGMTLEALLARTLERLLFSGRRSALPFIIFALIEGVLFGATLMPAPVFGGELHIERLQQSMDDRAAGISPAEAADRIARERLEAEAWRGAVQTEQKAADTSDADAQKRHRAEELARRKLESDKIILQELENLKRAREEADRGKDARHTADTPDGKRTRTTAKSASGTKVASGSAVHGRCTIGRVVYRKGRRWYVTGADDTLWQIAERFYGTGSAYPRIYRANRKRLRNPHVVRPCLALRLPGRG